MFEKYCNSVSNQYIIVILIKKTYKLYAYYIKLSYGSRVLRFNKWIFLEIDMSWNGLVDCIIIGFDRVHKYCCLPIIT